MKPHWPWGTEQSLGQCFCSCAHFLVVVSQLSQFTVLQSDDVMHWLCIPTVSLLRTRSLVFRQIDAPGVSRAGDPDETGQTVPALWAMDEQEERRRPSHVTGSTGSEPPSLLRPELP